MQRGYRDVADVRRIWLRTRSKPGSVFASGGMTLLSIYVREVTVETIKTGFRTEMEVRGTWPARAMLAKRQGVPSRVGRWHRQRRTVVRTILWAGRRYRLEIGAQTPRRNVRAEYFALGSRSYIVHQSYCLDFGLIRSSHSAFLGVLAQKPTGETAITRRMFTAALLRLSEELQEYQTKDHDSLENVILHTLAFLVRHFSQACAVRKRGCSGVR